MLWVLISIASNELLLMSSHNICLKTYVVDTYWKCIAKVLMEKQEKYQYLFGEKMSRPSPAPHC